MVVGEGEKPGAFLRLRWEGREGRRYLAVSVSEGCRLRLGRHDSGVLGGLAGLAGERERDVEDKYSITISVQFWSYCKLSCNVSSCL